MTKANEPPICKSLIERIASFLYLNDSERANAKWPTIKTWTDEEDAVAWLQRAEDLLGIVRQHQADHIGEDNKMVPSPDIVSGDEAVKRTERIMNQWLGCYKDINPNRIHKAAEEIVDELKQRGYSEADVSSTGLANIIESAFREGFNLGGDGEGVTEDEFWQHSQAKASIPPLLPDEQQREMRYLIENDGKVCWIYPDGSHRGISAEDVALINSKLRLPEAEIDKALISAAEILSNFKGEGNKLEEWQACYAMCFRQLNDAVQIINELKSTKPVSVSLDTIIGQILMHAPAMGINLKTAHGNPAENACHFAKVVLDAAGVPYVE